MFKVLAGLCTLIWTLIGILIIASIVNETMLFIVNLVFGCVFIAIAYYLYCKSKNTSKLLSISFMGQEKLLVKQLLKLDFIFFILASLVGIIVLSGVISRTFLEKLAVFG